MKNIRYMISLLLVICCGIAYAGEASKTVTIQYRDKTGKIVTKQVPIVIQQSKLPDKVIDPKTYGDTGAEIRYVDTNRLIQRGYQILEYAPPGKTNAAGYQPYYDPSINSDVYMRIPRCENAGKTLYPGRW